MSATFFLYKLTTDNGGAPCVTKDLLTLAICKPSLRSAAGLGGWIFGVGDNKHLHNRVIYIAHVTGNIIRGSYYGARVFHSRPDCIYRWTNTGQLKPKPRPRYHGSLKDARKDVGVHPKYRRANILLSTNFRYFGGSPCKVALPEKVAAFIEHVGQGHRSGTLKPLKRALRSFQKQVWRSYPDRTVLGHPTHAGSRAKCHGGKHSEIC